MKKIINKKLVCIIMSVLIILAIGFFSLIPIISNTSNNVMYDTCIVIDAGHGGRDGGCVGENGSIEKELNLEYAKTLKKLLETRKFKVVMTRTNDEGLYDFDAKNKKTSDMRARAKIIMNAKPDLVVSIHMNSFPTKSVSGAKVFYKGGSEPSSTVAKCIQKSLHYYCETKSTVPAVGDYYILNCTDYTSVLVECGYVSNQEEEKKLLTKAYREKLMHSVFCGILISLGFNYY